MTIFGKRPSEYVAFAKVFLGSLVGWLVGCLVLFVTKKVTRDKAPSVART